MIAPDHELSIITGRSHDTKRWKSGTITWGDVLEKIATPYDHKQCGGYVLGSFRGTERTLEALIGRDGIVLDADNAGPDFAAQVLALFESQGWAVALHWTFSSNVRFPRWRVIIPTSRRTDAPEYRKISRWLMRELGKEQFDAGASAGPVQFMYWPATADANYEYHSLDGDPLNVEIALLEASMDDSDEDDHHDAAPYDGPDYDDMTPAQQAAADAHVQGQIDTWRQTFADALTWPEDYRDSKGRGWEGLAFRWAFVVALMAVHPGLNLADPETVHAEVLPAEFAADEKCRDKWHPALLQKAAARTPEALPRVLGATSVEDDFQPVEEDTVPDAFELAVQREAQRLRIQQAARDLLSRERLGADTLPAGISLADLLAEPDAEAAYRIDQLWPVGGKCLLAAQQKAGKTTLVGNLLRTLMDGDAFLDTYFAGTVERVVLIDNELSKHQLQAWLRAQGVRNEAGVEVRPMRGRMSTFNIIDPVIRSAWADELGPADVLIFDCLRPALDALGLSEDKEAGRFLEALDALAAEAGIGELLLVHHMGHSSERSRGDSRLLDWPDAIWNLKKSKGEEGQDSENHSDPRHFSAYGRDVDVPETQLIYDPEARRLSLGSGSRAQVRRDRITEAAIAYAVANPGCTKTAMVAGVRGALGTVANATVREAVETLIATSALRVEAGPRNAQFLHPNN